MPKGIHIFPQAPQLLSAHLHTPPRFRRGRSRHSTAARRGAGRLSLLCAVDPRQLRARLISPRGGHQRPTPDDERGERLKSAAFLAAAALIIFTPGLASALALRALDSLWVLAAWLAVKTALFLVPGLGMPAHNNQRTWLAYDHFNSEEIKAMKDMRSDPRSAGDGDSGVGAGLTTHNPAPTPAAGPR